MPPLWEQRRELKNEILAILSEYMNGRTLEKCQSLALGYAGMVADLMPLKKLNIWKELLLEISKQKESPGSAEPIHGYPGMVHLAQEEKELRALLKQWRDRGRAKLADSIEGFGNDYGPIWDVFDENVRQ